MVMVFVPLFFYSGFLMVVYFPVNIGIFLLATSLSLALYFGFMLVQSTAINVLSPGTESKTVLNAHLKRKLNEGDMVGPIHTFDAW